MASPVRSYGVTGLKPAQAPTPTAPRRFKYRNLIRKFTMRIVEAPMFNYMSVKANRVSMSSITTRFAFMSEMIGSTMIVFISMSMYDAMSKRSKRRKMFS